MWQRLCRPVKLLLHSLHASHDVDGHFLLLMPSTQSATHVNWPVAVLLNRPHHSQENGPNNPALYLFTGKKNKINVNVKRGIPTQWRGSGRWPVGHSYRNWVEGLSLSGFLLVLPLPFWSFFFLSCFLWSFVLNDHGLGLLHEKCCIQYPEVLQYCYFVI